jgi:hypothetical protein
VGSSLNQKRDLQIPAAEKRDGKHKRRVQSTSGPAFCVSHMFSGNKEVLE